VIKELTRVYLSFIVVYRKNILFLKIIFWFWFGSFIGFYSRLTTKKKSILRQKKNYENSNIFYHAKM
jgi:nitrate/nitrite transporter NarK